MEVSSLTSLQSRLDDVRSRVAMRQNPAGASVNEPAVSLNLSRQTQSSSVTNNIDPEQASTILNEVQMSASSSESFGDVHNLDINRVLQLIS